MPPANKWKTRKPCSPEHFQFQAIRRIWTSTICQPQSLQSHLFQRSIHPIRPSLMCYFFLHISSLDQRAAVWQSWHLTHFLPIRPSPVPQNCPSPSFLYFYQISTDQSQLCKSLIMKCRNLVQEKKCILHLPKNCPEEGGIGEYHT